MQKQETPNVEVGTASGAPAKSGRSALAPFASVKLTVTLLALIAATVLVGSWCPQESAVGQEKIIETFGETMALNLIQWGIADIFHSVWFLCLIGLLTLNMIACSVQRVFPKVRLMKLPMPWLKAPEIGRMPWHDTIAFNPQSTSEENLLDILTQKLKRQGYTVSRKDMRLTAEFGKFGRLAPTVTHIGLLTLLAGVTVTSWTGFSGFKPVRLGDDLTFQASEHSKLWIGKLPNWRVHVDATRRENYDTGEAKQWYSDLSVLAPQGNVLKKQQISVNNPLSYDNVDIYQSSWGLDSIKVAFNGNVHNMPLRTMGKTNAAFLPLDQNTILIFSLHDAAKPLRLFAKRPEWTSPKLLTEIPVGQSMNMGSVEVKYIGPVPVTGLQYKCDPGLPITYAAFAFIVMGVMLATVPHRHMWAAIADVAGEDEVQPLAVLSLGGRSVKAKVGFERSMQKLVQSLQESHGMQPPPAPDDNNEESHSAAEQAISRRPAEALALAQHHNEDS
jgi:cytochrome c biogenesis protein